MEPEPLPEGYYLPYFETILRDVRSRYDDLLLPRERERAVAFLALPLSARRLYVRMLTRKGPWFRQDGLRYPEIPDLPQALADLAGAGFCALGAQAGPDDLLPLLRRDELESLLDRIPVSRSRNLPRAALAGLLSGEAARPGVREQLAGSVPAAAPLELEWTRLLVFLFFGNGEQDLTDFVLADTGRIRFEAYPVDPRGRLFQARADVDFLLELGQLRLESEAAVAAGNLDRLGQITGTLLETFPHPGVRQQRRFHGLLNDLGRAWERLGDPDRALACYALSLRPPARERTVRLLAARKRLRQAAGLAAELAAAPWDVAEERFADRFLRRLARDENLAAAWVLTRPAPEPVPEIRLRLPRHASGLVEDAALEAARAGGWEGFFSENALWRGLFGLALWDILFAPVPGAFQHRFQSGPADLGDPGFLARRRDAFDRRMAELAAPGAFAARILDSAERKRGIANPFVDWRALAPDLLAAALAALPAAAGLSVFRAMAPNPLAFGHGFPDLFLHRADPPRCMLWEVKGPGDTLRPEQERWLRHFNQEGIEARVARVEYLPAPD